VKIYLRFWFNPADRRTQTSEFRSTDYMTSRCTR